MENGIGNQVSSHSINYNQTHETHTMNEATLGSIPTPMPVPNHAASTRGFGYGNGSPNNKHSMQSSSGDVYGGSYFGDEEGIDDDQSAGAYSFRIESASDSSSERLGGGIGSDFAGMDGHIHGVKNQSTIPKRGDFIGSIEDHAAHAMHMISTSFSVLLSPALRRSTLLLWIIW